MASLARRLLMPLQLPAILTGAKSFESGSLLGSPSLNRRGLHRWRVATAARLTAWRRRRLAARIRPEWRADFERDGFVVVPNAMPPEDFAELRHQLLERRWPTRQMAQGDTLTRRAAVGPDMLAQIPALERLLQSDWWRGLTRYVASFDIEPLYYVQAILRRPKGEPDPQMETHADSFHSSMKAWLFLDDVAPGEGAFSYVRGSHRASPERLDWEHDMAQRMVAESDRHARRGSFRVREGDLQRMNLPPRDELAVAANTLVVADTFGFHARGPSSPSLNRVELFAFSRRNPFWPFLGGDLFSLPGIAPRRMEVLWKIRDQFPSFLRQPWRALGPIVVNASGKKVKGPRPR